MFYLTYAPGPPLSEFVDYFWLFDGGQAPRKERIVRSGTSELVINLRDDEIRIHNGEQSKQLKRFSGAVEILKYGKEARRFDQTRPQLWTC